MTYLEKFTELLTATPGMTARQLYIAGDFSNTHCGREISRLIHAGKLFGILVTPASRYFISVEMMEAARATVLREEAAHIEAKRQARLARARVYEANRTKRSQAARPPRQPKPKKVKPPKVPKPIVFAKPKKTPAVRFADLKEPDLTQFKVTVLPGFTGAPKWAGERTW